MRFFACFLLAAALLALPARAQTIEEALGTAALRESMPEAARDILGDSEGDWGERILDTLLRALPQTVKGAFASAGLMLAVVLICSVSQAADSSGRSTDYVLLAGVAAIGAAAVADVNSYMNSGVQALETLQDYSRVLLPVLAGAAAASGAVGSAAAKSAATAIFMDILLAAARAVVLPAICAYAALSIANAAVGNDALKTAARLMKRICTLLLSCLSGAFVVWISVISIVTGSADAAAARLTKTVVSSALPVVGHMLSGAADTLAAAAAGVRGTAGVFGLLVVLCVCLTPFLTLGARYLAYKFTAAACGCLDGGRLAELLDAIGSCFGMLLALTGSGAVFLFVSVFSFMRSAF